MAWVSAHEETQGETIIGRKKNQGRVVQMETKTEKKEYNVQKGVKWACWWYNNFKNLEMEWV